MFSFVITTSNSQPYQLFNEWTLEIPFFKDKIGQVQNELFFELFIIVSLDYFRNQLAGINSDVHHVQEEINFRHQSSLDVWVGKAGHEKEVNDLLEQVIIVELFVDQPLEQDINKVINNVDVPDNILNFPLLDVIGCFDKRILEILKDFHNIILGLFGGHVWLPVEKHVEHFFLNHDMHVLFQFSLLLNEVWVSCIVWTADDDICFC